jgi:hypothetical protein
MLKGTYEMADAVLVFDLWCLRSLSYRLRVSKIVASIAHIAFSE